MQITSNEMPTSVRIEASTLCQLSCVGCYRNRPNTGTLGEGYLKFIDFKNFIESHPYIKSVELSNSGEIFLNPELIEIVKYAFDKNIKLSAGGGVNFNTVSEEMIEALVKYRFNKMTIAIDGASQEIYSIYRRNGNYDKVIENIAALNKFKLEYVSEYPKLAWQYVLMAHNEYDVIKAKKQAALLNMKIYFKTTWEAGYVPKNVEMLRAETGLQFLTRGESEQNTPISRICKMLWTSPQINWDGRLLGCCCVYKMDFGVNIFEVSLREALNTPQYIYAKRLVCGETPPLLPAMQNNVPCIKCASYRRMVASGIFYDSREMASLLKFKTLKLPSIAKLVDALGGDRGKHVVFYGAGEGMRAILKDLRWLGVPFDFPIWDINADKIGEIEGHKVIKPDFYTHVPAGSVAIITILSDTAARHQVRDQLTESGFIVFTSLKDFLSDVGL